MNTYNAIEPGEQLWWFGVGVLLAFILFFFAFGVIFILLSILLQRMQAKILLRFVPVCSSI